MFKVTYLYSASVVVETTDVRVLCDPWFTDGIYDGSWFTFPKPFWDPVERAGDVDYVYVSHIHPDHYDPIFIKQYFAEYGIKPVLIEPTMVPVLGRRMERDGIPYVACANLEIGSTAIRLVPAAGSNSSDRDSSLIVSHKGFAFVNVNDSVFSPELIARIRSVVERVSLLAVGYSGAGPFPQCFSKPIDEMRTEGLRKKKQFLDQACEFVAALGAEVVLPFAGQYLLGGRLSALNEFRGAADATEVVCSAETFVPGDDGISGYDLEEGVSFGSRRLVPYSVSEVGRRIEEISAALFPYEKIDPHGLPPDDLAVVATKAYEAALQRGAGVRNAVLRIVVEETKQALEFSLDPEDPWVNSGWAPTPDASSAGTSRQLVEVGVKAAYLSELLSGASFWGNALIGSHLTIDRKPDVYNPEIDAFLYALKCNP